MLRSILYPKRRYAACPPPRLTSHLSLVIQYPEVAQNSAKLAPTWAQTSTKTGVPHRPVGPKMGHPIGPRFQSSPGGVLRASWEPSGAALGRFWGHLGASWGRPGGGLVRFGPSCGRLGGVLEVSCARCSVQRGLNLGMLSWIQFFNRCLVDFASQNRSPNLEKSLNSIGNFALVAFRLF